MSGGGSIPATPVPNTADTNALVTFEQYREITTDVTTLPNDVTDAIADALEYVQLRCNRTLLYAQYVERLYIYKNGIVYPSAIPLDQQATDTSVGQPGLVQGNGIWVGWFNPLPTMPVWPGVIPPQTDVTYWGGYTQSTLPVRLRRLIAKVAFFHLHPFVSAGSPALAKSVSSGGVSIGGDLSQMISGDSQMRRDLNRFKRRQVKAWQS